MEQHGWGLDMEQQQQQQEVKVWRASSRLLPVPRRWLVLARYNRPLLFQTDIHCVIHSLETNLVRRAESQTK